MDSEFSKSRLAGGCLVAFVLGSAVNMMFFMVTLRINVTILSAVLCLIPGIALIIAGRRSTRRDFGKGLIVGGCVIALLGSACGAIFTATQVGH